MTSTLSPELTQQNDASGALPDWGAIGERLVAAFPQYPARDVLTELVNAHESALYVGTADGDMGEVVECMANYAMKVRSGQITPSGRIAPESRTPSTPEAETDE
jgi:hypothetical protein